MRSVYHNWIDENTKILTPEEVAQVRQLLSSYRAWYILFSILFTITFTASLVLFVMAYQQRSTVPPDSKKFTVMLYTMTSSALLAMFFCLAMSHSQCQSLEMLKAVYAQKMRNSIGNEQQLVDETDNAKKTV